MVVLNDRASVNGNRAYNTRAGEGGGIVNGGTATMNDQSSVKGNTAGQVGGGIYNYGILTLNDWSTVSDNAAYSGAGIFTWTNGTLILNDRSSVQANTARGFGGGISGGNRTHASA